MTADLTAEEAVAILNNIETALIEEGMEQRAAEMHDAIATLDAARPSDDLTGLRTAAVQLRAAAVKAGAHIVVTTDYPDGVKAFGILCDAIDVMDAALARLEPGETGSA